MKTETGIKRQGNENVLENNIMERFISMMRELQLMSRLTRSKYSLPVEKEEFKMEYINKNLNDMVGSEDSKDMGS